MNKKELRDELFNLKLQYSMTKELKEKEILKNKQEQIKRGLKHTIYEEMVEKGKSK